MLQFLHIILDKDYFPVKYRSKNENFVLKKFIYNFKIFLQQIDEFPVVVVVVLYNKLLRNMSKPFSFLVL
jgi:hypothetical protein